MQKKIRKMLKKEKLSAKQKRLLIFLLAKLGFRGLTTADAVTKARDVVTAMTGNIHFPAPNPSLTDISAAATALEDAEANLNGTRINTGIRNAMRETLNGLMSSIQTYVDNVAQGNLEIIASADMEIRLPKQKAVTPPAPEKLNAKFTPVEGQVKLKWKTVKKKLYYIVEGGPDAPATIYTNLAQPTKASVIIDGLVPGQKYRFRVFTVNSAGKSAASEEVTCRPIQY